MKYPLPAYAATIWYNGQGYTLILPEGDGERRLTFTRLADAEEHLRMHYELAQERRQAALRGTLASPHARVEFDMLGGRYHQLAKPMSDARREELRRIADDFLRTKPRPKPKGKAKTMTLEDLGL